MLVTHESKRQKNQVKNKERRTARARGWCENAGPLHKMDQYHIALFSCCSLCVWDILPAHLVPAPPIAHREGKFAFFLMARSVKSTRAPASIPIISSQKKKAPAPPTLFSPSRKVDKKRPRPCGS
nr:hypothetical protein [Pandoravirus aubagnensis]